MDVGGTRANWGAGPANNEGVLTSDRIAMGGGLVMAEELMGFHKLGDLETRRSLPDKVQEVCRKCLRGDARSTCREYSAIGSWV